MDDKIDANGTPEEQSWGDPDGKGIMARMEEAFDGPSVEDTKAQVADEMSEALKQTDLEVEPEAVPDPVVEGDDSSETPEVSEDTPEAPEALIDENFFGSDEPEETKEEAKEEDFDEAGFDAQTATEVKGLDPKQGDAWKKLKAELKEFKKTAKDAVVPPDVQTRMAELESKAQEAESLRERMEAVSAKSAVLQVESGDRYLSEVVEPANKVMRDVEEIAALYDDVDASTLKNYVKQTDRAKRHEMLSAIEDLNDSDKAEIIRHGLDYQGYVSKRQSMLKNAQVEVERNEVARIESEEKLLNEQRDTVKTIQRDIWKRYEAVIPGLVDDNGARTPEMEKLMGKALSIDFGAARATDQAYAAFAGVTLPHAMKELRALQVKLEAYEGKAKKKAASSPSPSNSIGTTPVKEKTASTFMEALAGADLR